jgi:hypothetical protein
MPRLLAAAHPGKIGDALYSLPLLRYLSRRDNVLFDFYTSEYCRPLKELFEYQPCINNVYISQEYKLDNFNCGAQPWYVPVNKEYDKVYQLGFQRTPDQMLHQFIAAEQGVHEPLSVEYDYPVMSYELQHRLESLVGLDDYICLAPRHSSNYNNIFDDLALYTPSVIIGGPSDYRGYGLDLTGLTLLETLTVLSRSHGFVGLMSSQLVLANGFNIPRIALGGYHSDMRHAIKYHLNHYPHDPVTVEDVLRLL